jgi:[glutamine synthetase] adenylyltransferase / [glutamine synthetase]-adenylyl-L-tyrosine phosphorylase
MTVAGPTAPARVARRLARLGFADAAAAGRMLASEPVCWWDSAANTPTNHAAAAVVAALGRAPDPDLALRALADVMSNAAPAEAASLREALETNRELRGRLIALLGTSVPIGTDLCDHPEDWRVLLGRYDAAALPERLAAAVGADPADPVVGTSGSRAARPKSEAVAALRRTYRRELAAIAGRDLAGDLDIRTVTQLLADLAGHTLQAALAIAAAGTPPNSAPARLAIIAMGKAGGRELNYLSDVDVIFVAEPERESTSTLATSPVDEAGALATAAKLAAETMRICAAVAWEVDAALRPEGKAGPLVRTLASHEAYYRRWASTWEFQALLKARPVAGDLALGQRYIDAISPLVWTAAERPDFVADVQAMRRRVLAHVRPQLATREIKLGAGGLRDVEFAVQLLQLVHGRGDESLRVAATLPALDALRDGGYVGRDDAVSLRDAYRFLRTAEHRLQLRRLRRTHLVPDDADEVLVLARAMGFRPDRRGDARDVWNAEWALHGREVRRLHEKLFYRPLLDAVARVPSDALRLTPAEAGRRLGALGYSDPDGALRHIDALTRGLSRRAVLQKALLPVMLSYFSEAPDPDAGLRAYRQVSDALGSTPWYLRLLRDEGLVAARLAYVLGASRYAADMLVNAPEALQLLTDDVALRPRPNAEVRAAFVDAAARRVDPSAAVAVVRSLRRVELLRTAFADLLGLLDVIEVGRALSAITDATLEAALHAARHAVASHFDVAQLPIDFTVIAMGRLGGCELGYGSDADVVFVYAPGSGVSDELTARMAHEVAEGLRRLLAAPSGDPPLHVDANLRPEGRNGPLVRSLASFEQYYARWSSPWEAQALLRARICVGDVGLGERYLRLIDSVRYPSAGLASDDLREIRRVKARVDSERLPRGADPSTHLKLGRGGLTDIEWTIQLLQLQSGAVVSGLRTPQTVEALHAAVGAGLLSDEDGRTLEAAWRLATKTRNAIMLARNRAEDQLPPPGTAQRAVGRILGYPGGTEAGRLLDDYRRTARRARRVVERVFYGRTGSPTAATRTRAGGASGGGSNAP